MAARGLQAYHHAWLSVHPDRNPQWLKDMLREGFDIHHLDGDHDNNEPSNLVLIDAVDHMRLHGMNLHEGIKGWRRRLQEKSMAARAKRKAPTANADLDIHEPICQRRHLGSLHSGLNELDVRAYRSRLQTSFT